MSEFLLNRIWAELKQSSVNYYYADLLIDKQIFNSKCFNICIAALSSGGAILSLISLYFPLATSIIIALAAIINQFHPVFFLKSEELTRLCSLRTDYYVLRNKLENLFCDTHFDKITDVQSQRQLTQIIEEYAEKQTELSKLFGKIINNIEEISIEKSDQYLNSIYNVERREK